MPPESRNKPSGGIFCFPVFFRSGKPSSKLRVPFIPDANVSTDDFSAQRRRSFCHMQRLITVEGYGQICMGSTLGNLPGIRVDAAGQVYSQHKGVALMQTAYQPAGSKTGRPKCTTEPGAICNELFTWADVYDTANHDERRAILQQFIKEIRVRKDYEISITLNASFNQVEQLKAVSTYDGAEIFEEISEKGA